MVGSSNQSPFSILPDHSRGHPHRQGTNPYMDSSDGRTLQAEYISSSAGKVTIKKGSREYTLPLSRFSPADQQYVAELASKPAPAITKAESRDARTYAKEEKDWEGYLKGGAIVVDFSGDVEVKAPAPLDL